MAPVAVLWNYGLSSGIMYVPMKNGNTRRDYKDSVKTI